jgi:hypothetical protein
MKRIRFFIANASKRGIREMRRMEWQRLKWEDPKKHEELNKGLLAKAFEKIYPE